MLRKRRVWPTLLVAVLGLGCFTFASTRRSWLRPTKPKPAAAQNPQAGTNTNRGVYVRRGSLHPQLIGNLNALGGRLEKPGKERLTVTGSFQRAGDPQPSILSAVFEFPDRLRLTAQNGVQTRVLTFDGQNAGAVGDSLTAPERDLIETLVCDTAEHFFSMRMLGQPMRFLGSRFTIDNRLSADYTGPYYDIYQIGDLIKPSPDQRQQAKTYYFNSDTLLLERVRYKIKSGGSEVLVEVLISDWRKAQTDQIARRIERIENGKSVFVLTLGSVDLSTRLDDGIFGS